MLNAIIKKSGLSLVLITIFLFSGCACNKSWKEGFLKGALAGAVVGGAGGYVSSDDSDDDAKNTGIGAGIGAVAGGIIGALTNKCEVAEVIKDVDSDGDGIIDSLDKCPGTPIGVEAASNGCPLDTDVDGVYDYLDKCPGTPTGAKVASNGCPLDSDGDGVYDYSDKCPGTPTGTKVASNGCPLDADGDGVYDYMDKCPGTPTGAKVASNGCPLDADGDGVYDYMDKCPGTPTGAEVDDRGCWVLKGVSFGTSKWSIKSESYPALDDVVVFLKRNPDVRVEIQGYTDNVGNAQHNQTLSERRAKSVMAYLVEKGTNSAQLSYKGYGVQNPIATNETSEGRAKNRRVELIVSN